MKPGIWIGILTLFVCCQGKTPQPPADVLPENDAILSEAIIPEEKESEDPLPAIQEEDKESINDERDFPLMFSREGIIELLNQRDSTGENFESFFNRFITDEEFQSSRVQFPVKDKTFEYNKISEYENEWEDPDFDALNGGFIKLIPLTKENWIFLTAEYFDEEQERYSQELDRYSKLPKAWYKQNGNIVFLNGEFYTCAVDYVMEFRKINNLWYMVKYEDHMVYPEDSDGNYMSIWK
ncbi:MAG: hypothetical protein LUG98_05080 [Tannerellaceae bacterium]|nr:hypothetical protein [Tannerellaceae bacterium]